MHVYNYVAWFRFLSFYTRQTKHIEHTKFKCRYDYDREWIREEQNSDVLISSYSIKMSKCSIDQTQFYFKNTHLFTRTISWEKSILLSHIDYNRHRVRTRKKKTEQCSSREWEEMKGMYLLNWTLFILSTGYEWHLPSLQLAGHSISN